MPGSMPPPARQRQPSAPRRPPQLPDQSAMRYQKVLLVAVLALGPVACDDALASLMGVDVSRYQGTINWTSAKNNGVAFAFAKATEGVDYIDPQFTNNMNNARLAGVPIGPYHFARPDSGVGSVSDPVKQDAINEANDFVDAIKPYYDNHPGAYLAPVLDVESLPFPTGTSTTTQRAYLSAWVKDFNSVVQSRLGLDVIIYTGGNYAQSYLTSDLASFDLWFAKPTGSTSVNPPTSANMGIWNDYLFWQYSWTGSISGISGDVDLDTFRGTLNDLQAYIVGGEPPLAGDYNGDGVVDAADYTKWRDTWTRTNTDLSADGNKSGAIDAGDRDVWAANYGAVAGSAAGVPEPTGIAVFVSLLATALLGRRGR